MRSLPTQRLLRFVTPVTLLGLAVASRPAGAASASAAVRLEAGLAQPVMLAGQKNRAHLRVSLFGEKAQATGPRPDANVCIAIDRSGSMTGEKMAAARDGARSALAKLRNTDYVSVIAYDSVVEVVVPARNASDRAAIEAGIAGIDARAGTALFAGVVKCAGEVRKFASRNRVNRIILLSDGQANEGPSSPAQLGALGASLAAEGISVATVGLGADYNEDLMVELALRSDGSHAFVQHAADLARFLDQELGMVAAVVARDVEVKVRGAAGAHPLRVIGRRADVVGQTVTTTLGKINGGRQHVFVIEMDVDAMQAGSKRTVADVEIAFRDLLGNRDVATRQRVEAQFTTAASEVEAKTDARVMSELGILNAGDMTEQAIQLRDKGDFAGAQRLLQQNAAQLEATAVKYKDKRVIDRANKAKQRANELSPAKDEWNVQRKKARRDISDDPLQGL
jgi:Ca-activated chloride channel family protein